MFDVHFRIKRYEISLFEATKMGPEMTRLTQNDIQDIPEMLKAYDDQLLSLTGMDLAGVACRTYGLPRSALYDYAAVARVGIVPITCGLGLIPGFAETVKAIVEYLGFAALITPAANVAGLAQAAQWGADVVLLSDDDDFQAIDFKAGISVHNSEATGRVFAAGLDLMAGGLEGKKVLVVGCGPVGRNAGHELMQRGAVLGVADKDLAKARRMAQELKHEVDGEVVAAQDLDRALREYRYILDATPAAGIMDTQHVAGNSLISAPGVPLGLTPEALQAASGRVLHDTLQLGVAAMLAAVIKGSNNQ